MKIICIGRNYGEHIAELKNETPAEPVVFLKPDTALIARDFPFVLPEFSNEIHYEAELVVKIIKVGKYIDVKFAHKYYDQVTVGIDFTARDLQEQLKQKGLPWEKAKAFDHSAMVGEFCNLSDFDTIDNIRFSMNRNQQTVQSVNTQEMIWSVDQIVSYVSQFFTLKTGDLIFTGTPAGVGKVHAKDLFEGYLEDRKVFSLNVK